MERLTYRGSEIMTEDGWFKPSYSCYSTKRIIERLTEYEDLEKQGLLLRLPCAVGSTVYVISSRYTECSKYKETWNDCYGCEDKDKCDSHEEYYIHINHSVSDEWIVRYMNDFGKTVFLTKEEAEQKLKEMEID